MSGTFSVSGLISGLDSDTLISQLVQIEQQPLIRMDEKISALEVEKSAIKELRTQLISLRNAFQDFSLFDTFNQFNATTSEDTVLTAEISGSDPVVGAYTVEVLQLATATVAKSSATMGGAIDPNAALNSSGIAEDVTAGTFTINGETFTIDPDTDSLNSILAQIEASDAGVYATYDSVTDTVTFENKTAGDTSVINFGSGDDEGESNFLDVIGVTEATQANGASGATAVTSTHNLGAVDATEALNAVNFAGGTLTAGTFKINGITFTVDPTSDSLSEVLSRINDSDAGVTASYDSSSDTIQIMSNTLGSRTISFQAGTSNFLSVTNLDSATQTAGKDAQFTINDGAVLTRNTNEVSDAVGGVTLKLLSTGASTVKVSADDDAVVEDITELITAYNETLDLFNAKLAEDGDLEGDGSLRAVENYLRTTIFNMVGGLGGDYASLAEIGITTGDDFDAQSVAHLELDEDALREALREDRTNVEQLFSNDDDTGIADQFYDYLDEVTRTTGFLNYRSKANGSIDQQIETINDQMDRLGDRIEQYEDRLRKQFSRLEQLSATYQTQSASLSSLSSSYAAYL